MNGFLGPYDRKASV